MQTIFVKTADMSLWEEAWDAEDKRYRENYKKNIEYLKTLSDEEKFELIWNDYVNKHCYDIR